MKKEQISQVRIDELKREIETHSFESRKSRRLGEIADAEYAEAMIEQRVREVRALEAGRDYFSGESVA